MVVVANGVIVGELREVGHVALQDVVEAHGCGAFTCGFRGRRIVGAEIGRLGQAVDVRTNGELGPDKEIGLAAGGIRFCGISDVAIGLLPHLIEAVNRAGCIGVPCEGVLAFRIGKLEGAARKGRVGGRAVHAGDAGVRNFPGEAGAAGGQEAVVVTWEAVFGSYGIGERADAVAQASVRRTTVERGGERSVWRLFGGAELEFGSTRNVSRELGGQRIFRARSAVLVDNFFGEQVIDMFSGLWLISGENMVETAVLANDDDDVLDGSGGVIFLLSL